MCADTTVHKEEDPSDGTSDYAFDQYALPSDLSTGIDLSTGVDDTTGGACRQYNQEELALLSGFNITYMSYQVMGTWIYIVGYII
jgi:hypothetical protein